ncbi:tetratricopeptide repeat protein [Amycolatopsis halotolerans]|uniref:Tetratricopeptide repeat protein n=1 Tax=Amycolatopsis halotolerans TaxID=330083 RepID=A0ABV7QCL0_9PSEU
MTEPATAEAIDRLSDDWQLDEAEELGRQAVRDFPDDPARWIALGKVQLIQSRREEALESFAHAVNCPESPALAAAWLVAALSQLRRFEEAHEAAEAGLIRFPDDAEILHARARIHCDQEDWASALPIFEQALAADPGRIDTERWRVMALASLNRYEEAEAAGRRAIERHPGEPDPLTTMGWMEDERDRDEEALAWYERALAVDPRSEWALRSRISTLWYLDRAEEAEDAAKAALELLPREPRLLAEMGWVADYRERDEEALTWFERALEIAPRFGVAHRWRVRKLRLLKRFGEAETALRDALEIRPDDPDLVKEGCWLAKDQSRFEEAVGWADRLLAVKPRDKLTLLSKVDLLCKQRRFAEAEGAAQEAIDLLPGDVGGLLTAGEVAEDQFRFEEALSWAQRAFAVDPQDLSVLQSRVFALRGLRRFEAAEEVVREAVGQHPDDPARWVLAGWVAGDLLRHEEALERYDRALALEPAHLPALRSRIETLRDLRRYSDAEAAAEDAIARCPENADLLVHRGWVYSEQHEHDRALDWFQRAADLDPGSSWAWRSRMSALVSLRRHGEAEAIFAEAVQHCPDEPELLMQRAWLATDRFRFDEALSWCERVLEFDPAHARALGERVASLRQLRRFEEAEAAANEAIELRPDEPDLLVQLGWVRYDQSRFEEAVDAFRRALDLDPGRAWALLALSVACLRLRRFDEAKESAQTILDRQPGNPAGLMQMAALCRTHGSAEEALQWYDQVLAVDPKHASALEWRVTALRRLRRFGEARAAVTEAIALCPDTPDLLVERALLLGDEGHFEEALESIRQALDLDPLHRLALEWRVTALRRLRRFPEAEEAAKEAIERRPDEPDLLVEMGLLHDEQLKYEESIGWFDRALRIDPFLVDAITGRSAALRSLRRFDEAERGVAEALERMPWSRSLREELVWIYHDSRRLDEADQQLALLRADARNSGEEAETAAQSGWIRFAAGDYPAAEERFRTACEKELDSADHQFGLAWCLVRQATPQRRDEAEKLCFSVLEKEKQYHAAHTCLGVLNFQRRQFAQAEQHFRRAVELDHHHASYVDLGALYSQLGRFDEAEAHLNAALERDWFDAQAHVELGYLHLQRGIDDPAGKPSASAARHFRQARQIDPANGSASLGLAVALMRSAGDFVEGEDVLRQALRRNDCDLPRWQLLVAVAKLLIERGDATQGRQFHADALAHAQEAISLASKEAEPYFVAAVARYKLAESAGDFPAKPMQRRKAIRDLRRCVKLDPGNVEAQRSLQIMEESLRITRSSTAGSVIVVVVGIAALIALWVAFFLSDKITGVMLTTLTPVLVGLMVVGLVLPFLIRLKLPGGVEADLSASIRQISSGPTGEETFGPGRFSVTAAASSPGPQGQLARL